MCQVIYNHPRINKTKTKCLKIEFLQYYPAFSNPPDCIYATQIVSQSGNKVFSTNKARCPQKS